ncbi:hypothetical protein A1355_15695 [Methylomonas koyamae]|uniref:TonB C-terminal domain-containing protein n=1 Tax=Methylomonas koyamae TaxID=702114 RepID=A0A177N1B5_9GAMM|nr:hypothetical protein A1355_15695 [Methylomonas koyamae]
MFRFPTSILEKPSARFSSGRAPSPSFVEDSRRGTIAPVFANPRINIPGAGKSRNRDVLFAIAVTVSGIHLLGVKCLFVPEQRSPEPEPLAIQVSTITIPAAKQTPVPPAKPPQASKPPRKRVQPKPKLIKTEQARAADFSELEQLLKQQLQPVSDMLPTPNQPEKPVFENQAQPYTEAYMSAAYDKNPKPDYPSVARSRGWQGRVVLKVLVSEAGQVETIGIEQSSGHETLDEAALEAVKNWQFVPAKRGEINEACSVLVPIIFSLKDQENA